MGTQVEGTYTEHDPKNPSAPKTYWKQWIPQEDIQFRRAPMPTMHGAHAYRALCERVKWCVHVCAEGHQEGDMENLDEGEVDDTEVGCPDGTKLQRAS